jgi:hypothetical protein
MTRSTTFAILLVPLALVQTSCGGGDGSALSCPLLADPNNCWASSALALQQCLPPGGDGVLAADRASCTFDDGSRVVFDSALPTSTLDLGELAFTVERDGTTCARFVDTFANRMELTANGETTVSELHAGGMFHLHCAGGPSYSASFSSLFDCAAMGVPGPTDGFNVETNLVEFRIASISTPDLIFTCTPP